jgi:hypothetical protein
VLSTVDVGSFEWVPSPSMPFQSAEDLNGEIALTCEPQLAIDVAEDATPWRQYDVLALAATVVAMLVAGTARNDDYASPFALAPVAMQAKEAPVVLESVGTSMKLYKCLMTAFDARPGEPSPDAAVVAGTLALEASRVLAQGTYRATTGECEMLQRLAMRLGLDWLAQVIDGSAEVVRQRAREVQERGQRPDNVAQ